jgi:hypothetical protein
MESEISYIKCKEKQADSFLNSPALRGIFPEDAIYQVSYRQFGPLLTIEGEDFVQEM